MCPSAIPLSAVSSPVHIDYNKGTNADRLTELKDNCTRMYALSDVQTN